MKIDVRWQTHFRIFEREYSPYRTQTTVCQKGYSETTWPKWTDRQTELCTRVETKC